MLQQPLPLYKTADKTFEEFIANGNEQTFHAMQQWAQGGGPWFVFVWGEAGVGKSHLMQAALRECANKNSQSMFVPLKLVHEMGPEILNELGKLDAIGIDDLDEVVGNREWETALFTLFNSLTENGARLLVSSATNPRFGEFILADLQSRLCSGLSYPLRDLDDERKKQYLINRAEQGDMAMSSQVADFIVTHHARDMHELSALFEKLDTATLSAGRSLSIPFVKEVIATN